MGEINALQLRDINLNFKTISIEKTMARDAKGAPFISKSPKTEAGRRVIPISETVMPLIMEIVENCGAKNKDDYLFLHKDKLVNGKVSLHSLRQTFATRCIEAGMQPKVLQKLLGHTDIQVTLNTYCDAFENFQNENIQKSDAYFADLGFAYNTKLMEKEA